MVRCRAVSITGGDVTGQDALAGDAIDIFEDVGTHAKSFKSPEGEKVLCACRVVVLSTVLVCLDHDSLLVMWTPRNSQPAPRPSFSYRKSMLISFVLFTFRERLLSWHHTAMSLTSYL